MGFDHPQWEMWQGSKHGVRSGLKRAGVLGPNAQAPTCQTCHMQNGNHDVHTGWGFLALRLPMPEDKQWTDDRVAILQALGVLDLSGKPTARLDAVKAADLARLDQGTFDTYRKEMLDTCNQCHSGNFAKVQLENGDKMIKEVDHLMAEGIREVAALYKEGVLQQPKTYAAAFPDLLTFHDAPTVIEQKLFVMFLEHRMRAFQGVFHANPDYALWYGWSEMQRDLTEIRELAAQAQRRARVELGQRVVCQNQVRVLAQLVNEVSFGIYADRFKLKAFLYQRITQHIRINGIVFQDYYVEMACCGHSISSTD
jgi:mono/diheme cytochrome c family protein